MRKIEYKVVTDQWESRKLMLFGSSGSFFSESVCAIFFGLGFGLVLWLRPLFARSRTSFSFANLLQPSGCLSCEASWKSRLHGITGGALGRWSIGTWVPVERKLSKESNAKREGEHGGSEALALSGVGWSLGDSSRMELGGVWWSELVGPSRVKFGRVSSLDC